MSWRPYVARLVLCCVALLAAKTFASTAVGALWQALADTFARWDPSGLPYYAIWCLLLLVWALNRPAVQVAWKPPPGAWSRRNILVVVAALVVTDALYGFKVVRIATGVSQPFELSTSLGYAISAAIAAPVVEELLFRGYLWHEITAAAPGRRSSVITGILVSSLLFAAWHLPAIFGPYPASLEEWPPLHAHFLFGVVMATLRWRLGSIGVGVLIHGVWNLL